MHSILVKDYMQHNAHAIPIDTNIKDAVESLLNDGVIGAPVIDGNDHLVGYVSEQDCIKEMLNDAFFCEEPASVRTVMKTEVVSVTPDTSIVEIAQSMLDRRPKNYPVVDSGKLVGIINRSHILRALLENEQDCYIRH
ncbi:CBS domain-containing protein [Pseudomaricurvus alkylphenolicus]|jgi:CBS domain-containing protein|uniref:CBS domain-containing protein n=1 Tax=Pseudomaricurvus alkylphenolicus TaxID=1306991 RepID=UPI00142302AD|nr:CBS domain-containing protein [Pseudomaricurvus alkylphenolicus]NIB41313.1 CBS domain-containing protein [Pseudomaricurvus alkylphenolicus]